jgi:hypothetical protein
MKLIEVSTWTPSVICQRPLLKFVVVVCGSHASVRGRREGRRILGGSISGFECCKLESALLERKSSNAVILAHTLSACSRRA